MEFFEILSLKSCSAEMVKAKHVYIKNIFWFTLIAKNQGGKLYKFLYCPLELKGSTSQLAIQAGFYSVLQLSPQMDNVGVLKFFLPCICLSN